MEHNVGGVIVTVEYLRDDDLFGKNTRVFKVYLTRGEEKISFDIQDSFANYTKEMYHSDLLNIILFNVWNIYESRNKQIKGLDEFAKKDWIDEIKVLTKLTDWS